MTAYNLGQLVGMLLWVVLGLGVLSLGGVAMSLMRQLGTKPEKSE